MSSHRSLRRVAALALAVGAAALAVAPVMAPVAAYAHPSAGPRAATAQHLRHRLAVVRGPSAPGCTRVRS
jgi:hypothetical protein